MNCRTFRWFVIVFLVCCCAEVALLPVLSAQAVDTTSWFRLLTVDSGLSISLNGTKLSARAMRIGHTVLVPLSVLHQAWGAACAVSPAGSTLTIGSRRAVWQGMSATYRLDHLDLPWSVVPVLSGGQLYVPLRELMEPMGAFVGKRTPSGDVVVAYSTKWQKEPWLRQGQLAQLETVNLTHTSVTRVATTRKVVAFTFDDNWDAVAAVRIAELFRTYNGHCTFFVIGTNVRMHPDAIRTMVRLGHDIGNHTLSHPAATSITDATFVKQIQACEQVLNGMGLTSRPYFRFPYFAEDSHLMRIVTDQGYITVGSAWTIEDTGPNRSAALSVATVRRFISPGVIFVGHANSMATYDAMKAVLPELARQGYSFVSISELLRGR
ncbi:MAG: polysaccharide deacetylase family protein [Caldiserica bacterium]|nr:polysaccharide deacetylase family protein [Caldisericota bacterium]